MQTLHIARAEFTLLERRWSHLRHQWRPGLSQQEPTDTGPAATPGTGSSSFQGVVVFAVWNTFFR